MAANQEIIIKQLQFSDKTPDNISGLSQLLSSLVSNRLDRFEVPAQFKLTAGERQYDGGQSFPIVLELANLESDHSQLNLSDLQHILRQVKAFLEATYDQTIEDGALTYLETRLSPEENPATLKNNLFEATEVLQAFLADKTAAKQKSGDIPFVLDPLKKAITANLLNAWDARINDVEGVRGYAQKFAQLRIGDTQLPTNPIVSVHEAKLIFDYFIDQLREFVESKATITIEGEKKNISEVLTPTEINKLKSSEIYFNVKEGGNTPGGLTTTTIFSEVDYYTIGFFIDLLHGKDGRKGVMAKLQGDLLLKDLPAPADEDAGEADSEGGSEDDQPAEPQLELVQLDEYLERVTQRVTEQLLTRLDLSILDQEEPDVQQKSLALLKELVAEVLATAQVRGRLQELEYEPEAGQPPVKVVNVGAGTVEITPQTQPLLDELILELEKDVWQEFEDQAQELLEAVIAQARSEDAATKVTDTIWTDLDEFVPTLQQQVADQIFAAVWTPEHLTPEQAVTPGLDTKVYQIILERLTPEANEVANQLTQLPEVLVEDNQTLAIYDPDAQRVMTDLRSRTQLQALVTFFANEVLQSLEIQVLVAELLEQAEYEQTDQSQPTQAQAQAVVPPPDLLDRLVQEYRQQTAQSAQLPETFEQWQALPPEQRLKLLSNYRQILIVQLQTKFLAEHPDISNLTVDQQQELQLLLSQVVDQRLDQLSPQEQLQLISIVERSRLLSQLWLDPTLRQRTSLLYERIVLSRVDELTESQEDASQLKQRIAARTRAIIILYGDDGALALDSLNSKEAATALFGDEFKAQLEDAQQRQRLIAIAKEYYQAHLAQMRRERGLDDDADYTEMATPLFDQMSEADFEAFDDPAMLAAHLEYIDLATLHLADTYLDNGDLQGQSAHDQAQIPPEAYQASSVTKKRGLLRRGTSPQKKAKDVLKRQASQLTNAFLKKAVAAVPFIGTAAALLADERTRKITLAALGAIAGFMAYTAKLFLTTGGGFLGGIVGGVVGGVAGLPGGVPGVIAGATSGWAGGTHAGYQLNPLGINSLNPSQIAQGNFSSITGSGTGTPALASVGNSFNVGTQAVAATLATTATATAVVSSTTMGAFLLPTETITSTGEYSKYVEIKKTASPQTVTEEEGGVADVTYTISIRAREGYKIQIMDATDEVTIRYNEEARGGNSGPTYIPPESELDIEAPLLGLLGVELAAGDAPLEIEYTIPFSQDDYHHASIINQFELTFDVIEGDETPANETAKTLIQVCFGECPAQQGGCWPASGELTQGPLGQPNKFGVTHENIQAIDIHNRRGTNVYSPYSGNACFYPQNSGWLCASNAVDVFGTQYCYGNHVVVTTDLGVILGFAHLDKFDPLFEEFVGDCTSVSAGQKIGEIGNSGLLKYEYNEGVHLHYELRPKTFLIQDYVPDPITIGPVVSSCGP